MSLSNIEIRQQNRDMVLKLLIPIAIVAKLIEHWVLPGKYFYDSRRMLITSLEGYVKGYSWGGSYELTADIFRKINIFHFTSLLGWSIAAGIIFNIVLIFMIARSKGFNIGQGIFTLMCVGLCNIYIFNIGKDIVQFVFFLMCYLIIINRFLPSWSKAVGCALILYWESTFFRNYYVIMAAFVVVLYVIFSFIRVKKITMKLYKIILVAALLYFIMFMFLFFAKNIMPKEYDDIMHCKDNTEYMTASTIIDDKIDYGDDLGKYMQNYVINSVRMMLPVELLKGGVFYVPFFIFQVMILYYVYMNFRELYNLSEINVIGLSVFMAYFMASILFEPDFGSFARHEAATFPIILLVIIDNWAILKKVTKHQEVRGVREYV